MPSPQPPTALLQQAVAHLAPVVPLLTELGELFTAAGHEIALVGGPVRDAFLGRTSPDLDFTTSASPEESQRLLAGWGDAHWDIGRDFGTIGARRGATTVEVTTYRADAYDGQTRKPLVAFGDNLEDDLVRRDFTMNAMALRLPSLEFVDPYSGLADLARKVLRTPGPPEVSFGDDPLRMMRAARFAAQLGASVAPEVERAMRERAATLEIVSAERIRDEFTKLVLAPDPRAGLEVLVDAGLAAYMLPELPALKLEVDEHHRHKDVYEHSLTVLEQAIALEGPAGGPEESVPGPDLVLRLAALLHDIGKPPTRRFESGGGVSFHHHEVVGAKMAARRLKALRYDKETGQGRGPPRRAAPAVPRLRRRPVDRLCGTPLRHRRRAPAPAPAPAHPLRLDDPQPAQGSPALAHLRRARGADRAADGAGGAGEGASRARRQRDRRGSGITPGPVLGRAYKYLLGVRLDEGPMGKEAARDRLLQWWAEQPEAGSAGLGGASERAGTETAQARQPALTRRPGPNGPPLLRGFSRLPHVEGCPGGQRWGVLPMSGWVPACLALAVPRRVGEG